MVKEAPSGPDNYEFDLVGPADSKVPFVGYVSVLDPTMAAAQTMIRGSQNVYKTLKGTIANRSGLLLRGTVDGTEAGVVSSFEWETNLGTTRPVRQLSSGLLQVEYDPGTGPQWYTIMSGLPSNVCSYIAWYDPNAGKDYLLMVNGQQNINQWAGGIVVINSASDVAGIIEGILNPNNITNANTGEFCSGGIGYAVGDILTVQGGDNDALLEVDSIIAGAVSQALVSNGGSAYTVGDYVKVSNGTIEALLQVTAAPGGVVSAVSIVTVGYGCALGTYATTNVETAGSPSGLTITINAIANTIASWHFTNNGDGYAQSTNFAPQATTGGTGSGATVWIALLTTGRATITGSSTLPELGFDGDLSPTEGTFTLSGGTFTCNGVTYTYTCLGDNGFSFIGVSPDPTPTAGQVAVSNVTTTDTSATSTDAPYTASDSSQQYAAALEDTFFNDAIAVVNNQVHLICYSSRIIHVSSAFHFDHYDVYQLDVGVIRTPGYPDLMQLDSPGRAVGSQKGNAVLFGSDGDSYLITRKAAIYNQGTDFEALSYENVTVTKEKGADLSSPIGQDFVDYIGDVLIYLDDNNQVREYGTIRNIATPVYPVLSLDVYKELQAVDFTGGQLRTVADESSETVYVVSPKTGLLYMYMIRQKINSLGNLVAERLWQPPFVVAASRVAVITGTTYVHSNTHPQLYQLWDTGQYRDNTPNGDSAYLSRVFFGYQNFGRRQGKFSFDKVFLEGFMAHGSPIYGDAYYDYQGATYIKPIVVNKTGTAVGSKLAKLYIGTPPTQLGSEPLGDNPLGMGIVQLPDDLLPKFRCVRGVPSKPCFDFTLDVYSYDLDSQWEIESYGFNAQQSPYAATELQS